MAPEPPQPNQTPKYSLTGGGVSNQGDTRVYGGGLINMGSFSGGGGMGLPLLILGLFGIVWAYFYLVVRKGARFRFSWNPSGEPPEPPQPTQATEYSQTKSPRTPGSRRIPGTQGSVLGLDLDPGVRRAANSQIGGGGHNPQVQGHIRGGDGGNINLGSAYSGGGGMGLPRRGMGLPRTLILGLFGIVCAYFYLSVQTEWFKLEVHWNPLEVPLQPPQPTL